MWLAVCACLCARKHCRCTLVLCSFHLFPKIYTIYACVWYGAVLPTLSFLTLGLFSSVLVFTWVFDVLLLFGPVMLLPVHLLWAILAIVLTTLGCGASNHDHVHYDFSPNTNAPVVVTYYN